MPLFPVNKWWNKDLNQGSLTTPKLMPLITITCCLFRDIFVSSALNLELSLCPVNQTQPDRNQGV